MIRHCAWCGRRLRLWQLRTCRRCSWALAYSDSPPCRARAHQQAPADSLLRPWPGSWHQ